MSRRNSEPTRRARSVVIGLASVAMALGAFAVSAGQASAAVPGNEADNGGISVFGCAGRSCI